MDGLSYELICQDIIQQVLGETLKGKNIVKHDIRVSNGVRERQVDLYWESPEVLGAYTCFIIECKSWSRTVEAADIEGLHGFIAYSKNMKGVFITTKGYQEGAIKCCKAYGITPILIRKAEPDEFSLNKIIINHSFPQISNIKSDFGIIEKLDTTISVEHGDYQIILNGKTEDLNQYCNDLIREKIRSLGNNHSNPLIIEEKLDDAYLTDGLIKPKLEYIKISFDLFYSTYTQVIDLEKYIYKNVLIDEISYFSLSGVNKIKED